MLVGEVMVHDCCYDDDDEGREERERKGGREGELEGLRRRCGGALRSLYIWVVLPCESSTRGVPLHQLRKNHTISRRYLLAERKHESNLFTPPPQGYEARHEEK